MPSSQHFASQSRVLLAGSEKKPAETATIPPAPAPAEPETPSTGQVTVSVILKPRAPIDVEKLAAPAARLTREQLTEQHGPDPAAVQLVHDFAAEFGLTVEPAQGAGHRTIHLTGTEAEMEKAFGVTFSAFEHEGVKYRVREGAIYLPQELSGHVLAVLGLDNRPQAKPHMRKVKANATSVSYTPVQVGQLYGFPSGTATGKGQTIGIIELGGGFRPADITAYFTSLKLPVPTVTAVLVDKAKNKPGTASGADGEVMLDIEVSGAVAPGANIAVYFAPNTDQGFTDAISTAIHDTTHKPSVISISWGGPESSWTQQAMTALDTACQAAAAVGVTITAASGDDGSTDGVSGTANHVDFPASSPHVLACGGTKLTGSGTTITSEVVWNELSANEGATGGGVSAVFGLPTWQAKAGVPTAPAPGGRGVPDVAGDADPVTGYSVRVDGQTMVIGGTSAVAPLWAGLIAVANEQNKVDAGFINPALYAAGTKACRDITSGNNGGFSAKTGWDPCTGLGSPNGKGVIAALAPVTHQTLEKVGVE